MGKKLIAAGFSVIVAALLFISCTGPKGDTGPAGPSGSNVLVMTLQDGQSPYSDYSGISDSYIDSVNATSTYMNTGLLFIGYLGGTGSSNRAFIKVDMSPIVPANAFIVKAYLSLHSYIGSGGYPVITAYKVSTAHIVTLPIATWIKCNMMENWTTPGGDYYATAASDSVNLQNVSNDLVTLTMDPALVQSWLSNPSANNGILLKSGNEGSSDGMTEFYDSTASQVSLRPKLTVYYKLP